MKQKLWICFFSLFITMHTFAQSTTRITGKLVDYETDEPIIGAIVSLKENNILTKTNEQGIFVFQPLQPGKDFVVLNDINIVGDKEFPIEINAGEQINLKTFRVRRNTVNAQKYIGVIDEALLIEDGLDDGGLAQDASTMVIFSNDVYLKNVGYQFFPFRFHIRGYESRFEEKYINGVDFNDQVRGVFSYSSIGALNNITKNGDAVNYFNPSAYSFSDIGGSENINMRAGDYKRGGKLTLSATNRNYYARAMANYSTGMQDNGWAFMGSIGGRYSHEGSIDGTFYRNLSYAFAVEKELENGRHRLSFVTFGSPVERGQQGGSFQEVYDLVGDNRYNPNWGYQNGEKRNARVVKAYDPTAILSHTFKINEKSTLTNGLGIHYNRYGRSRLNWYNGPDPRPDYYRYLPSYNKDNDKAFEYYRYLWKKTCGKNNISQINWDKLWEINHTNNIEGDGSAIYMVEEQRKDLFEIALNSTFDTKFTENIKFNAGIGYKYSYSKQFKTVEDLLGAKYVLDIDKFAERDFPGDFETIQNDLNRPNRKVCVDGIFGYDYRFNIHSANLWFQQQHEYRNIDFYYGAKFKYTQFYREGKMKNGRYPENSYGKGEIHDFMDFEAKAGLTYKFNGRHFLKGNISYQTKAPLVNQVYISPNITDNVADNLKSLGIFSADFNYIFSLPSLTGRVGVFATTFFDDMMRISYYHDAERTFVNHVLSGVDKEHHGIELGVNYKLNKNWSFDFVGTIAEYYYSNNPNGSISYENGSKQNIEETVYLNNYYVGGMPQVLGSLGINYFYNFWFFNLNVNGVGENYIKVAPLRRLASNYIGILPPDASGFDPKAYCAYRKLTHQERFDTAFTVDLSIGKIFYLKNRKSINFNLSISNLLNDKDVKTGGYEQGRVNLEHPYRFASRYFYMQGINAFLNLSYNF